MPRHNIDNDTVKTESCDMKFTLEQAEKIDGVPSKRTIQRHRDNGEISMEKDNKGRWVVDGSELSRKYNIPIFIIETAYKKNSPMTKNDRYADDMPRHGTDNDIAKNTLRIKVLELELNSERKEKTFFEKQLSLAEKQLEKTELHLEDWKKQAQILLLTAPQKEKIITPPTPPLPVAKSFPWVITITASVIILATIGAIIYTIAPEKLTQNFSATEKTITAPAKIQPQENILNSSDVTEKLSLPTNNSLNQLTKTPAETPHKPAQPLSTPKGE